eukprot:SAG22_NODE_451_length_10354_cov_5.184983_3_plen_177_part_00
MMLKEIQDKIDQLESPHNGACEQKLLPRPLLPSPPGEAHRDTGRHPPPPSPAPETDSTNDRRGVGLVLDRASAFGIGGKKRKAFGEEDELRKAMAMANERLMNLDFVMPDDDIKTDLETINKVSRNRSATVPAQTDSQNSLPCRPRTCFFAAGLCFAELPLTCAFSFLVAHRALKS